jgi:predicted aminopeptidase
MSMVRAVALCALALLLTAANSGCAKLGYYTQAIGGQLEILSKRQPIETLLDDPETDAQLRTQLAAVLAMRAFASNDLALPDNKSYRTYVDLKRPYVVWNVFAAPELSLTPLQWCFVVVGCINYRGYFSPTGADKFAGKLRQQGYDVYVGGVTAYSTLGWFRDPVLNTMLSKSQTDVAALIFHELAHQRVYVRDDTVFNESFAVTVEREGVRRWLARSGTQEQFQRYLMRKQRYQQFVQLIMRYRQRLIELYATTKPDAEKRALKTALFTELRADYARLKQSWNGYAGYDEWFARDLNNAHLVPLGLYHEYVPAFQALLAQHGGDLVAFYQAVEEIGKLPKAQRVARLQSLQPAKVSRKR